ncbi:MAG: hypothetical protein AB1540_14825, partial [Bdellovibrionota bacterium]
MHIKNRFAPITILLFALLSTPCFGAFLGDILSLPPHANYKQIFTPNFKIIYPDEFEPEARLSAQYLEESHGFLSQTFQYAPSHKTTIILADNQDFANGVTSAVGRQGIVLFLTAPDPYSSIGEYDHWLRSLIIHEYTHYLTLEQRRGIFEIAHYLLGNLVFPNHLWPTWLAEGMAVYAESAFSHGGRGHGTYYSTLTRDGLFRDVLGKKDFLKFDELMGPIPNYPFGESQYFAGYGIIEEMMLKLGKDAPARYAEESSWRIPFFLNGALENISPASLKPEISFFKLWTDWISRQATRLKPELEWLKSSGAEDPRFLTQAQETALGARLSPDGKKLAYFLNSSHQRPSLQLIELSELNADAHVLPESKKLDDTISGAGISWSEDGKRIYYAKADFRGSFDTYSDLFAYELESGQVTRLTKRERAKDPDHCLVRGKANNEGGSTETTPMLVYSTQRARVSEVRLLNLKDGSIRTLYRAKDHHHVSTPRCNPEGTKAYFAEHSTEVLESIFSADLLTGETQHVAGGGKQGFGALFPSPTVGGKIYFSRVKDGYYDLARLDVSTKQIEVLARSSGGYWLPSVSSDGSKLAASYVTSQGIRAVLLDQEKLEKFTLHNTDHAPVAKPAVFRELPEHKTNVDPAPANPIDSIETDYNLLSSLAPRIWAPHLLLSGAQTQVGATVIGWDDVDQLEYNLFAFYDTIADKPEGFFGTFHRVGPYRLGLSASSQVTDYAVNSRGQTRYNEERKLTLNLSRPFPGNFTTVTPKALVEWARTWRDGDFEQRAFASNFRLGAGVDYDTRQRYRYSVFSERGSLGQADGRRFFSRGEGAWKALVSWEQLFSVFPDHSVFGVTLYGAVAPRPLAHVPESVVKVGGYGTLSDLDPPLKGYPLGQFRTQRAGIIHAEYGVPLAQLFQGFDTWPLFLRNFGAFAFYNAAKLRTSEHGYSPLIDGVGGGLVLNTVLGYNLPFQLKL